MEALRVIVEHRYLGR